MFTLNDDDHIVTAFAEPWPMDDNPIWVIVRDGRGNLRREEIPSEEQTDTMLTLYKISTSVNTSLIWAAKTVASRNAKLSNQNHEISHSDGEVDG